MTYTRPLPTPTKYSAPFWDAARRGRLMLQHCTSCGEAQHPAGPICRNCWNGSLEWRAVSGRGAIYSYTVVHRTATPGFRDETPYVVAIVELAEGPRLTTNIVGCPIETVRIGMAVKAIFDAVTEDVTLVKFGSVEAGREA